MLPYIYKFLFFIVCGKQYKRNLERRFNYSVPTLCAMQRMYRSHDFMLRKHVQNVKLNIKYMNFNTYCVLYL
jgi:hypothetical protein